MFSRNPKTAVGITLEGSVLRVVQLERTRDKTLQLTAIRRVSLLGEEEGEVPERQLVAAGAEGAEGEEAPQAVQADANDPFADAALSPLMAGDDDLDDAAPVVAAMLNAIGGFDLRNVAVNVPDTHVFFHHMVVDPNSKGKELLQRARHELDVASGGSVTEDVSVALGNAGNMLAAARVGNCPVADAAIAANEFLKKQRIGVTSAVPDELVIADLVRRLSPVEDPESVTAVVHVGDDTTRVLLLLGNSILRIAPIIHESANSRTLPRTLVSRILLVEDEAKMRRLDRIVLTGAAQWVGAADWLQPEFPDIEVSYLEFSSIEVKEEANTDVAEQFTVAIGLAWSLLDPPPQQGWIELLPKQIQELNKNGLAWHGVATTIATGVGVGLMGLMAVGLWRAEREARAELVKVEEQIAEVEEVAFRAMEMANEADDLEQDLVRLQRLAGRRRMWSDVLTSAATNFKQIGGCWINVIADSRGGMELQGMTVRRPRLPDLANRMGDVVLRSASELRVRTRPIYRFEFLSGPDVEQEIAAANALNAAMHAARALENRSYEPTAPAATPGNTGTSPPPPPGKGPGGSTDT